VPLRAVLFDLDGTLVDTNYQHVQAWATAFAATGHDVDAVAIHRAIGLPSEDLVRHLTGAPDDRAAELHDAQWAEMRPSTRAFARAADLLRCCTDRGWRVAWATSASPDDVAAFTPLLDPDGLLHAVIGAEDTSRGKPAPDVVTAALAAVGAGPAEAVMIGDSVWDVGAALRADVASLGLLSGGIGRSELLDAGAGAVAADPADLLAHLDELLEQARGAG
jgi:phosphoglycolate phosphatase-like HAD superfamily hydrolase